MNKMTSIKKKTEGGVDTDGRKVVKGVGGLYQSYISKTTPYRQEKCGGKGVGGKAPNWGRVPRKGVKRKLTPLLV